MTDPLAPPDAPETTLRRLPTQEAIDIAAQCWCDDETRLIVMDPPLAFAFAQRVQSLLDEGNEAAVAMNEENDRHIARIVELESELRTVDLVLGNRTALDSQPTRDAKIAHIIRVAQANDPKGELAKALAERDALQADRDRLRDENADLKRMVNRINGINDIVQAERDTALARLTKPTAIVIDAIQDTVEKRQAIRDEAVSDTLDRVRETFEQWRQSRPFLTPPNRGEWFSHPTGQAFIDAIESLRPASPPAGHYVTELSAEQMDREVVTSPPAEPSA